MDIPLSEAKLQSTTTTWNIRRGSLDEALTFETSLSSSDVDCYSDHRKPLILSPPPSDSSPCDLTLHFTHPHEIKQVYVRSTARVFEIYYSAPPHTLNEYLCTVRCGLASTPAELPHKPDAVGSLSTASTTSFTVTEEPSNTECGNCSNEDGWVDVNFNDSSRLATAETSLLHKEDICFQPDSQDFYEATAEINDADPVSSVTLRLLSIQSGEFIFVDEVYVFADPVVTTEAESSATPLETSSGSALLSMFVPVLLQLSKSRMTKMQDPRGSAFGERSVNQETERSATGGAVLSNTVKTAATQSDLLNGASARMCQPELPLHTPNLQSRPHPACRDDYYSCSKIERTLDELVSRVSRIEDFCLRFEENMLKPISNMETRLERVENQLELLIKNPQVPKAGCTRYSAPEFSCIESEWNAIESEWNSFFTGGDDEVGIVKSESSKKDDDCIQDSCASTSGEYSCVRDQPHEMHPGLVVTAPDFSNIDDEVDNDRIGTGLDIVEDNVKKPRSIDDVLASALAGFLSSSITRPTDCADTVEINEQLSDVDRTGIASPAALSVASSKPLDCVSVVEEAGNVSCMEEKGIAPSSAFTQFDSHSSGEETTDAVDRHGCVFGEGDSKKPYCSFADGSVGGLSKMKHCDLNWREDDDDCAARTLVSDYCDTPLADSAAPKLDFVDALGIHEGDVDSSLKEKIAEDRPSIPNYIIELSACAHKVDYNEPVLDVKFSNLDNSSTNTSLEALFTNMPDTVSEVHRVKEDNLSSFSEQCELVTIGNEESEENPVTSNDQVFFDNLNSGCFASNAEQEVQDCFDCSPQGLCFAILLLGTDDSCYNLI